LADVCIVFTDFVLILTFV